MDQRFKNMVESFTLCINGVRRFHRMAKKELFPSIELLAWLEAQEIFPKWYWKGRDGLEVAALGSVLTLSSPPEFDSGNDSPARFWGGQAFSPNSSAKDQLWADFPRCAYFLPKYEIVRQADRLELFTHAIDGPITENLSIAPHYFGAASLGLNDCHHTPSHENWIALIEKTLSAIEGSSLEKVVMARRSTHLFNSSINAMELLSRMQAKGSIRFAVQFSKDSTFIGATPERLYKRLGRSLFTEAIAGTRKRGQTEAEDAFLEKELLENLKERGEFNFVKTSIFQALEPLCKTVSCEAEDGVIKTPNVQHLHNPFEATLLNGTSDAEILAALHPTAAMGGIPRRSALEHLLQYEPFERGWYASPLGYVSQAEAEFAVGIRSALVKENALNLFAGAGIVADSIPTKEWEELEHKTSLWRNLCKPVS